MRGAGAVAAAAKLIAGTSGPRLGVVLSAQHSNEDNFALLTLARDGAGSIYAAASSAGIAQLVRIRQTDFRRTGVLALASVRFVIGQITEGVSPTFVLDDVRIIRDSDQDGLTDDIDPFTTNADANGNQIPDGWDNRYALTNFTAFADADGVAVSQIARLELLAPEERLNPEQLMADLKILGKDAAYLPDAAAIVAHLAAKVQGGDIVCVFSNGGFTLQGNPLALQGGLVNVSGNNTHNIATTLTAPPAATRRAASAAEMSSAR